MMITLELLERQGIDLGTRVAVTTLARTTRIGPYNDAVARTTALYGQQHELLSIVVGPYIIPVSAIETIQKEPNQ